MGTFQSAAAETPDAPYSVTEEKLQECRHGDNDEDCFLLLLVPCLEREGVEGKLVKPNPPRGVIFSAACAVTAYRNNMTISTLSTLYTASVYTSSLISNIKFLSW